MISISMLLVFASGVDLIWWIASSVVVFVTVTVVDDFDAAFDADDVALDKGSVGLEDCVWVAFIDSIASFLKIVC